MDGLSDNDLKHFKQRLLRRRDELRTELRDDAADSDSKNFSNMSGGVRDPGDDSQVVQMSDLAISSMEKQQAELRAVEDALERIEDGSYGECLDCGGDIPRARLEVYPTAKRCTQCQSRRENLYRDVTPSL